MPALIGLAIGVDKVSARERERERQRGRENVRSRTKLYPSSPKSAVGKSPLGRLGERERERESEPGVDYDFIHNIRAVHPTLALALRHFARIAGCCHSNARTYQLFFCVYPSSRIGSCTADMARVWECVRVCRVYVCLCVCICRVCAYRARF